jgi:SPP1 gp7 family putative phage head morphogenesis protein
MAAARAPKQGRAPRSVRQARVMSHRARRQLAPSPDEAVARVAAEVGRAFEAWAQRFVDLVVRDVVAPSRKADCVESTSTIKSLLHEDATVRQLFEEAGRASPRREVLEGAFEMVDKQSADELRVAGVRTADVVPGLPAKQADWIRQNTDLIKAEQDLRRRVERVIADPLNEGRSVKDIAKLLQEQAGYSKSRAELTARDQTLKLHGQIQQERQERAGVTRYVWTTSQDERVRPDHAELDGTVQAWDDPPVVDQRTGRRGHPGFDYQCRCTAVPVLDEDVEAGGAPPPPEPVMQPTQAELDLARRQAEAEARRRQLEAEADARIAAARAEAERQARELAAADARARAEAERQAAAVRAEAEARVVQAQEAVPPARRVLAAEELIAQAESLELKRNASREEVAQVVESGLVGKSLKDLRAIPFTAEDLATDTSLIRLRAYKHFAETGNVEDNLGRSVGGLPQITVEADGQVYLSNGRHRLTVAREMGLRQIYAHVRKLGKRGGAVWDYVGYIRI